MLVLETLPPTVADLADAVIHRDGSRPWTAHQSVGGFRLTDLADPVDQQDAATKHYVDELAEGAGDVRGPSASTDTAIVRWDGTTGRLLKDSNWLLSDVGKLRGRSSYSLMHAPTSAATITLDLTADNIQLVTLDQDATLAVAQVSVGQRFAVRIAQDDTGGHALEWFPGIRWPGNVVPSVTQTPRRWDWFGFVCVGLDSYGQALHDGFVLGQNYGD
jgi:hypothetical protein